MRKQAYQSIGLDFAARHSCYYFYYIAADYRSKTVAALTLVTAFYVRHTRRSTF